MEAGHIEIHVSLGVKGRKPETQMGRQRHEGQETARHPHGQTKNGSKPKQISTKPELKTSIHQVPQKQYTTNKEVQNDARARSNIHKTA